MTTRKKDNRQGRKYSDLEIARALAIYDIEGTVDAVVKQVGATKDTVRKWINNRQDYEGGGSVVKAETFAELYSRQRDAILTECVELQKLALQQARDKMSSASAYQAVLMYGILHDKINNTGKYGSQEQAGSTTNILISNMGQEEATELMTRVLERANSSGKKQD
ncbi:MAG: hypothetical protein PHE79_09665 [Eubacteriales bacterium]|nr:hypothetical protein [Eubacteriales bacterium]